MRDRKAISDPRRILIIAGDEIDLALLLADLEHVGYSVVAVIQDMESATTAMYERSFSLVLVSLAGSVVKKPANAIGGEDVLTQRIEIATRLRNEVSVPVVFLVGDPSVECLTHARRASPFGFVFLPYQRGQLHVVIELACEHSEVESRLARQEKRYRDIVENSPVGIFQTSLDGRFLNANLSMASSLGYESPEELINSHKHFYDFFSSPENQRDFVQDGINSTGFVEIESPILHRNGSQKICKLQYRIVRDKNGSPDYIEGFSQDITESKQSDDALRLLNQKLMGEIAERRHTEEFLRESEDRYKNFLENFEGIAFRLRKKENDLYEPVFYHGAVEKISGYQEGDLLREEPRWDGLLHPDDQLLMPKGLYSPDSLSGTLIDREYRIIRRDGQIRWVHEVARISSDENEGLTFLQGSIYDVTLTKQREFEIRAVATVSSRLSMATSRREIPRTLLQQVSQLLHARGTALMLFDSESGKAVCEMGTGAWEKQVGRELADEDITYKVMADRRFYLNNDALNIVKLLDSNSAHELRGLACVPLVAQTQIIGALWVAKNNPVTGEELRAFAAIGDMAASVLQQSNLYDKLQQAYDSTLEGWALALELRDHETQGHSIRVAEATVQLARALGLAGEDLVNVRRGALLHDIGKIAVPDDILLKPGPLSNREREIMELHPVYAYEMLSPIKFLQKAVEIPYNHHEHWDGKGYPRGIRGEQIPLSARIFAIIDVWDSLLSERPYRPSWPKPKTFEYLREQDNRQFDPQVVEAFFDVFGK